MREKTDTAEISVPVRVYCVTCACGESLEFGVRSDSDNDLLVTVSEHYCEQKEVE